MSQAAVRFIRKNGKIIPIRAAAQGARAAGAVAVTAAAAHGTRASGHSPNAKHPAFKTNGALDAAGLGISLASGAIAAATFSTPKGFVAGHAAAHALDALGVTANLASVAGKGHAKERAKQGAKQEIRNLVLGNLVYGAGVIALPKNRAAAKAYASKAASVVGSLVALGKKALRR